MPTQYVFGDLEIVSIYFGIEFIQACIHHLEQEHCLETQPLQITPVYLHTNPHITLSKQRPIKLYRVGTVTGPHRYIEVHQQSFLFLRVHICSYPFDSHNGAARNVPHFLHNPISSAAQIADFFQIVSVDIKRFVSDCYCRSLVKVGWGRTKTFQWHCTLKFGPLVLCYFYVHNGDFGRNLYLQFRVLFTSRHDWPF